MKKNLTFCISFAIPALLILKLSLSAVSSPASRPLLSILLRSRFYWDVTQQVERLVDKE